MSNTFTVVVGEKGQITVPAELRKKYGLNKGAVLIMEDNGTRLSFVPTVVIPMYEFNWDLEADLSEQDIMTGNVKRYSSGEYLQEANKRIALKQQAFRKAKSTNIQSSGKSTSNIKNPKSTGK